MTTSTPIASIFRAIATLSGHSMTSPMTCGRTRAPRGPPRGSCARGPGPSPPRTSRRPCTSSRPRGSRRPSSSGRRRSDGRGTARGARAPRAGPRPGSAACRPPASRRPPAPRSRPWPAPRPASGGRATAGPWGPVRRRVELMCIGSVSRRVMRGAERELLQLDDGAAERGGLRRRRTGTPRRPPRASSAGPRGYLSPSFSRKSAGWPSFAIIARSPSVSIHPRSGSGRARART